MHTQIRRNILLLRKQRDEVHIISVAPTGRLNRDLVVRIAVDVSFRGPPVVFGLPFLLGCLQPVAPDVEAMEVFGIGGLVLVGLWTDFAELQQGIEVGDICGFD